MRFYDFSLLHFIITHRSVKINKFSSVTHSPFHFSVLFGHWRIDEKCLRNPILLDHSLFHLFTNICVRLTHLSNEWDDDRAFLNIFFYFSMWSRREFTTEWGDFDEFSFVYSLFLAWFLFLLTYFLFCCKVNFFSCNKFDFFLIYRKYEINSVS